MSTAIRPVITCSACGTTGPGRRKAGLCNRCYARAQHQTRQCASCGQNRRHLAGGLCARCYRLSRTRLVRCPGCGEDRPVHFGDRCERCKRRAAAAAGTCQDCGRDVTRLWSGRCRSCDQRTRETSGVCADCGELTRLTSRRCKACRHFRWRHPLGLCPDCGRNQPIGSAGACRSCQAARRAASRILKQDKPPTRPRPVLGPEGQRLLQTLTEYGQARGWAESTLLRARRSLAAVLADGEDLGEPPWEAKRVRTFLTARHLVALRTVEFLTDEGLAYGTDHAVFDDWLTRQLAGFPAAISAEVRIWADILQGRGSRPARPRDTRTIQGYLRALQTPLATWAGRYQSLREVTTDDVTARLAPLGGATRLLTLSAMRSLFKTLKARRVLFINPAAPLTGRAVQPPPVLALEPARRAGLLSRLNQPGERLIVLLAGVHALRPSQIRVLTLDAADPGTSSLFVAGRIRRLDRLTAEQLRAWLNDRHARWPVTANPYLLINEATAGGVNPVSRHYIQHATRQAGTTVQNLRCDRILDEVHASGGDPLRLTHLFGISDPTAIRYCAELGTLDQAIEHPDTGKGR